jgi:hypothetical protein
MEKTLKVLNDLEKRGRIEKYAIGGGIAALFYTEPFLTYDMDVFVFLPASQRNLVLLSPIYDDLREKGYREDKEHVLIEGIPVQFIPAYNPLVEEAVEKAKEVKYKRVKTRVLRPEYLFAVMLQTDRTKDRARMSLFFDEAKMDQGELTRILKRHKLNEKWRRFRKQIYGA